MAQMIVGHYDAASDECKTQGREWYPEAQLWCERVARKAPPGIGAARVAGVVAALSPRTRWAANLRVAKAAVEASCHQDDRRERIRMACRTAFPLNREKAVKILVDGKNPFDMQLGTKSDAFLRAIMGDGDSVVVDVWAARSVGLDPNRLTPARIHDCVAAYREAAPLVGVCARDLQAIVWCHVRGKHD